MKNFRLALFFGLGVCVTVVLLFPYLLVLLPKMPSSTLPLWLLLSIQTLQAGVLAFLGSWLGLFLGAPLGLDSPLLRAWVYRQPAPAPAQVQVQAKTRTQLVLAAAIGLFVGVIIALLDWLVFMPRQPEIIQAVGAKIARWKGLLASFYGGFSEEVLLRLFFMTLIAWALCKISGKRKPILFVSAAIVATLVFAAGHLPAVAQMTPLTAWVVIRVLVLNSVGGIAFGLLYWRRGLEHAMVAHFCADLILHVVV